MCCIYVLFIQTNLYCITLLNKAELLFYTKKRAQLLNIIKYDLKAAAYSWDKTEHLEKIKLDEDSTMECIPKCTEMLQVNKPIRVQPEVKGGGRGEFSTVQHCQTEMEIQYNMYKRRVQ